MAAVKASPPQSSASPVSSPEAIAPEQNPPVQKRKGGRKPVYATQEERKMRNRAAQAAFRERRTEYIKHLEATIKVHEEQLSGLQQSSRQAADEVLMLRYKNSLLERILLEKGIDVAAELRAYNHASQYDDRPVASHPPQVADRRPMHQPMPLSQSSGGLHRPGLRRPSQPKRSIIGPQDTIFIKASPDSPRPIVTSSHPSPSPVVAIPTPPDQSAFQLPQQQQGLSSRYQSSGISVAQSFYPSPFQAHMAELGKLPRGDSVIDQEYEAESLDLGEDDTQSSHDQQPTPDGRDDSDLSMGNVGPSTRPPRTEGPGAFMFDTNFDSMFAGDPAPKGDGGLSDMMRQYNHGMPFGFSTSNLR